MFYDFRWIAWNVGKIESHGLTVDQVEEVVNAARRPYPKPMGNDKWLVIGATPDGILIQAIYLVDADASLFVIHARSLTPNERRRHRRRP